MFDDLLRKSDNPLHTYAKLRAIGHKKPHCTVQHNGVSIVS